MKGFTSTLGPMFTNGCYYFGVISSLKILYYVVSANLRYQSTPLLLFNMSRSSRKNIKIKGGIDCLGQRAFVAGMCRLFILQSAKTLDRLERCFTLAFFQWLFQWRSKSAVKFSLGAVEFGYSNIRLWSMYDQLQQPKCFYRFCSFVSQPFSVFFSDAFSQLHFAFHLVKLRKPFEFSANRNGADKTEKIGWSMFYVIYFFTKRQKRSFYLRSVGTEGFFLYVCEDLWNTLRV